MDWFRSWHGAPTDTKWLGVARKAGVAPGLVVAAVWQLLDRASRAEDRGSVSGYDAEGLAYFNGCEPEDIEAIISALNDKGVLAGERFVNWDRHQVKREDGGAERAKAWRERKKTEENADRTQTNASERKRTPDKIREDNKPPLVPPLQGDAPKKSQKKGSRLEPDAPLSQANREMAEGEGIGNPDREWERFRDHWISQPGQKGVKLDWDATWRNWCRRSVDMNGVQARDGPADLEAARAAAKKASEEAEARKARMAKKKAAEFEAMKARNEERAGQ